MEALLARLPNDSLLIGIGAMAGLFVGWLLTWAVSARRHASLRRRHEIARAGQFRKERRLEQQLAQTGDFLNQTRAEREILIMRLNAAGAHIQTTQRANSHQLTHFAAQLRGIARVEREKGRLIRSAFDRGEQEARQVEQLQVRIRRQNLALDALSDALEHAKRAQRIADQRRGPGGRFEGAVFDAPPSSGPSARPGPRGVVERIVEVPVERVVYRDREVRVEVPFDFPRTLSPRASARRPSSRGPAAARSAGASAASSAPGHGAAPAGTRRGPSAG